MRTGHRTTGTWTRPSWPLACCAVALAGSGALAACSSPAAVPASPAGTSASASPGATPSPTPSSTPTPTPSPTPTPEPTNPLTGLPQAEPRPVLVVKLDNTRNAQPHAGLDRADVVYLEEVEYGITRIAAVFSSRVPQRIGPVRSARITDIDLLAQYGRPAFAYSGAQRKMFPVLAAASIADVSPYRLYSAYSRDSGRRAPYNEFLDGRAALAAAPRASLAPDLGFTFDAAVPEGGLTATKADMRWGYSQATFRYDPATGLYAVSLNGERAGAEGKDSGQNAATVVIQSVKQKPSAFFDKGGGNTPHAQTIGSGSAIVLRDGLAWTVRWSRPSATSGTTFTTEDGTVLPFKPGQTWVVLYDRARTPVVKPMTPPVAATASPSTSSPSASASAASGSASGSPSGTPRS